MPRVMPRCGLACALCLICATSAQATAATTRTGAWMARQLQAGHRVVLSGVTVTGPVNLDRVDTVRRTFECHDCVFTGPISAHDVIFKRLVDLAGSTFDARVDFTGARFEGPALFRAAAADNQPITNEPDCRFRGAAVFSVAAFDDVASFRHAGFCAKADFREARFSDSTFSGAWFMTAEFARAAFRGLTLFNDVHFRRHASFGEADFRQRADFSRTFFLNGGDFADSRFAGGASFLSAEFRARLQRRGGEDPAEEAATFQDAVSGGDLNFTFAKFKHQVTNFSHFSSTGSLVFDDAIFDADSGFTLEFIQVQDLRLDVDAVKGIGDRAEQIAVLTKIEDSAKARGDVGTANDAHYRMRVLKSEDYSSMWKGLDLVFYRGIAGYLVRPLRPLLVLLVLATAFAVLRMRSRRVERTDAEGRRPAFGRRVWVRAGRRCETFAGCLLDTLAIAGPRWRSGDRTLALHERLEVVAYRLLVICAVVGLANSNPTLRDMLDSLM
jgi:uncharacterized protein YjbI with pentapeptide repeats